jgi:hypothetical protein
MRSICASVVKSLPAMRSMMRRPRKASLRSPELVIDPSGNASEAAVDSRIGSLGAISLRRFVGAPMVADSLDFVDVAQPVAHPAMLPVLATKENDALGAD